MKKTKKSRIIKHPNVLGVILTGLARFLIWLRYKKQITGLDKIKEKGDSGILFLPNHPALIDPVIIFTILYRDFAPVSIADEVQIDRPVIRWLAKFFGTKTIPNLEKRGIQYAEKRKDILQNAGDSLKQGANLLLYPAGHIKRSRFERIGASSGVEAILKSVPSARIVLIRQNGLWGSRFSFAFSGNAPSVSKTLIQGLKFILINGIFFMPRRKIEYEFVEPADFPARCGRLAINSYLEKFYNENAWPNLSVPYFFWRKNGILELPDPKAPHIKGDVSQVPPATKEIVFEKLKEITGIEDLKPSDRLNYDLGMDSLNISELVIWFKDEFGFDINFPESLETVNDVLLATTGQGVSSGEIELNPPDKKWFKNKGGGIAQIPEGKTLTEIFIKKAEGRLSQVVFADQRTGEKTYREVIRYIFILKPVIESFEEKYVGIMLPASVMASILYYCVLFAGKIPVMVNWTTGARTVNHSLNLLGVRNVLTSRALVSRLDNQGTPLHEMSGKFVYLEDLKNRISIPAKLKGTVKSYLSWKSLINVLPADNAVVLFTSGSEALPKAVGLSHGNILSNIRGISEFVDIKESDSLTGILPPFHSFGLTVTTVFPASIGIRAVYHPNPAESAHIARLVQVYKPTFLLGTPSFLNGILRVADSHQLKSLRIAVTGAEKCPDQTYENLVRINPNMVILEGYGVTECSPIISVNPYSEPRRGTIGKVLSSYEYVLMDPQTGERVPFGHTGLILVRGPSVFAGYLNYDGKPPFVEFEGKLWYDTGDLAVESKDGYLTFKGRRKRFIKIGSEMISLPAIESALLPYFQSPEDDAPQIAVEATPDTENPEIVLFSVAPLDRRKVNEYIRQSGLSPLHNIRKVVNIPYIPLLGNGKTDYRMLKEKLRKQI